jgi:hypothetical protein
MGAVPQHPLRGSIGEGRMGKDVAHRDSVHARVLSVKVVCHNLGC